jgi:predicted DNA-binding transcriptional regulator YafY
VSKIQDTAVRISAILKCIPKYPHKIATSTLSDKLADRGYSISDRTLQRDLINIISRHPVDCYKEEKPYRYGYMKGAIIPDTGMDTQTALALTLAQDHLKKIMPQTALDLLKNKFKEAERHISSHEKNVLAHWHSRVRAIPNGKSLLPAEVDEDVWRNVSEALINKNQLNVTYRNPKGELKNWNIHPQGLISRHSANYLIVTINDYQDLKMLALHRIQKAENTHNKCHQFDEKIINDYMNSSSTGWAYDKENNSGGLIEKEITLIADVSPYTASVLSETKLCVQQTLDPVANSDWQRITATVPNNQETLWWIYSLNSNIHVHEPKEWVREIKENLERVRGMYSAAT